MRASTLLPIVIVVALVGYAAIRVVNKPPTDPYAKSNTNFYNSTAATPIPMNLNQADITPINTTVTATLKTSKGDMVLALDGKAAPLAVGNFVYLAKQGFYNGVTFHRVIPGFMIQTGDPLSKDVSQRARHGTGGPGYKFKNEDNTLGFVRGALGLANSGRDTNGSQFFIMVHDYPSLNGGYTNFGMVTSGLDVADAIVSVPRDPNDNPLEPVTINEVVIAE